jgi:hypothetical protein
MNELRLDSLIALLDDPDDSVFNLVLEELLKEDISIVDRLEHIWETSFEKLVQKRIEFIIQQIQLKDTKVKIRNWATQKSIDLFEGIFLISRYQYPELKLKPVQVQLEKIRKDIWLEFKNSLTSIEKITILNHIFFNHYKFKINCDNIDSPQNGYINRILDTRNGNPISIAILYTLVGRSLNLPVHYIDSESHPLVAYFDNTMAKLINGQNSNNILFYINTSNKGAIIGPKEVEYIQPSVDVPANLTEPCPDRTIIKRLIEKLSNDYLLAGSPEKVNYLREIAEIL